MLSPGLMRRLARADAPLTEAAFGKMALSFDGESALRWDGDVGTQLAFNASQVSVGTVPAGSEWRRNPIPSGLWSRVGPQFEPYCTESRECAEYFTTFSFGPGQAGVCKCSGYSNGGPLLPNLEIVDRVRIPAGLASGRYVLQWRWDCEESDQVWASCSDVTIAA